MFALPAHLICFCSCTLSKLIGYYALRNETLPGRFQGPSGRALFSDEGGFTFSEVRFEGTLHEGLKAASLEGFKGASPSEQRVEKALKAAFERA